MQKDVLFILKAPFVDPALEGTWFCNSCATLEGVLMVNPHWAERIEVRRMGFPRPRHDIIELIGEANQAMPVLVLAETSKPPEGAKQHGRRWFIDDPKAISRYLAAAHGGAGPHP